MKEIKWDDLNLSFEARRNREVFARFGLAVHNAQCLEKQLGIMLVLAEPHFCSRCSEERGSLFDTVLSRSFGAIWKRLQAAVPFRSDLVERISEAKRRRNYLVHDYFWDHAADLFDAKKQEMLICELTTMADYFSEVDDELAEITSKYAHCIGVTEDAVTSELERLMRIQD